MTNFIKFIIAAKLQEFKKNLRVCCTFMQRNNCLTSLTDLDELS